MNDIVAKRIEIETVRTESFSMDYFRFGHGKETLVILPGLSVQSVMAFALYMYDDYGHASYDTAPDYKERILRFLMSEGKAFHN